MIRSLRLDAKMQVPVDYDKSFQQADETFLYQLVFDPICRRLVPLNELPEGIRPGDLAFAGPYPCATCHVCDTVKPLYNGHLGDRVEWPV